MTSTVHNARGLSTLGTTGFPMIEFGCRPERTICMVRSRPVSDVLSLVTVQMKEDDREFTLVDIGTILGLAHLIPEGDRCWIVNCHINLRTFNEVY